MGIDKEVKIYQEAPPLPALTFINPNIQHLSLHTAKHYKEAVTTTHTFASAKTDISGGIRLIATPN